MQSYIKTISDLTFQIKDENSEDSWCEEVYNLKNWINAKNKHEVDNYYNSFLFGVVYTNRLYRSRVNCFYEVLKTIQQVDGVEEILKTSEYITSFGCGPGPEIAAYICFIRQDLKCYNNSLSITAVDQLNYWNVFIEAVAHLDDYATVEFKKATLNIKYLETMEKSDICIMSYPHAVNFENIWKALKKKFALVVVIDQAKKVLLDKARIHGYEIMNFECVGNKTFFYYINHNFALSTFYSGNEYDDDYDHYSHNEEYYDQYEDYYDQHEDFYDQYEDYYDPYEDDYDHYEDDYHFYEDDCNHYEDNYKDYYDSMDHFRSNTGMKLCSRNIHKMDHFSTNCNELVDKFINCGHLIKIKCFQYNIDHKCTSEISKKCLRDLHEKTILCGTSFICEETIKIQLPCDHYITIKCYEENSTCEEMVEFLLKCNHPKMIPCQSNVKRNQDLSNLEKCSVMINKKLKCGHIQSIKCHQINDTLDCTKIITKMCDRNIHQQNVICSKSFICKELCSYTFDCGHKSKFLCNEIEYYMTQKYICRVMILYQLECGHSQLVECRNNNSKGIACKETIIMVCNRNLHKHKVTCGTSIICYEPTPIKLKCQHTIMIECSKKLSIINPVDCQMIVTKSCERQIHKHEIACHRKIICQEMCTKMLNCGHSTMVKCNEYNINHIEYCGKNFYRQCDNNMHEASIKCGSKYKCSKMVSLKLPCEHKKEIICGNIDIRNKYIECDFVKECGHRCHVKCVCKMLVFYSIDKTSMKEKDVKESEPLCGHFAGKLCKEICNKPLICGHYCKNCCNKCLNGRLHGKCMEKCIKTLICGHQCKDLCHQDNCFNCIKLCFVNKIQMFSIFNSVNYNEIKAQWTEISSIITKKSSVKISFYFNNILMNMEKSNSSKHWLDYYRYTIPFVRRIMTFYNIVLSEDFPDFLFPYIDCVKENLSHLLEWIDPINRNLSKSIQNDFVFEFQRLKYIYFLCKISLSAEKEGKWEALEKYDELLKQIMNIKYSKKYHSEIVDKTNNIYINL